MNSSVSKSRTHKAKLNMLFSLSHQFIALICGIVIPKLMLNAFGSEIYGATSSIANFLSYITLLEGGIGAVTRSALYKALARRSTEQVSAIISETKRFYRIIGIVFSVYVLVIACFFKQIAHTDAFDFWYSFTLVIVIAMATAAEYFIGISYSLLLQADQAQYVVLLFRIGSTLLNAAAVIILVSLKCDIITVKLVSSLVLSVRPILLSLYVRRRYRLVEVKGAKNMLENKQSAIGQHIAWTLHNNTDITVLTVFKNLSLVSVYSVHNMVVSQVQSILSAFSTGMEAVFGSMYANRETENLQKTFGYYETMISLLSTSLYAITAVMIVPFVRIYTRNLVDVEYVNPLFAFMLVLASFLYCLRTPYSHMIIAAGHFKETRMAAYGEAIINITSSIVLVIRIGLIGVAIGTVLATSFRFAYYVFYLSGHVLYRKIGLFVKRITANAASFAAICLLGNLVVKKIEMDTYIKWAVGSLIVAAIAAGISLGVNFICYREDVKAIVQKGFGNVIEKLRKRSRKHVNH
ncbi:MAG: polysaccharide biosynthesis C-terminal domain-containing protein [Clostridia bacterium]|nr:polysaccharide biosynthesis C-terminal domain-containing protein [Clostridia bacterium]